MSGGLNRAFKSACRLIISDGARPTLTHRTGTRYWDNGDYYATIMVGVLSNKMWTFYAQSYAPNSRLPLPAQPI